MNTKKTAKPMKAARPGRLSPEPLPRLPKPASECSTTGLIAELSREVGATLRGRKRRREIGERKMMRERGLGVDYFTN